MTRHIAIAISTSVLVLAACPKQPEKEIKPANTLVAPPTTVANQLPGAPAAPGGISGKVVETMNSGRYTYVQVASAGKKVWAAAPEFKIAVGDTVNLPQGMLMRKFKSESLDRVFDEIYFVDRASVGGDKTAATSMPAGHPSVPAGTEPAGEIKKIAKAKGGYTVAEIFAKKNELKDKSIKLRGQVAKYNAQIMGKNWMHIKDGSGAAGTDDLTLTTAGSAKVGDTVLIEGKLVLDKDFGAGYKYAVIIEDAKVSVE